MSEPFDSLLSLRADGPAGVDLAPAVADALAQRRPLVLLESAVVSHGLPAAVAIRTVAEMVADAADEGVLAVVTAVVNGRIIVGASPGDLARLTGGQVAKIAARDLPTALALGHTGGTTVSATAAIADLIGVPVMATGGIGGVHLGAERTWDVSADLSALSSHPVLVVCSGAKAICDIPKTVEFLETAGVTVVGFRTDRFPYFLAADSGVPAPRRIDSPQDAAAILMAQRALGQRSGVVVANPIPLAEALDAGEVADAVAQARAKAERAGAVGSNLTPFLLDALAEITAGASLRANVALLRANARLAARIAVAIRNSLNLHN
ncbi:MAG TPA: pseudouridine-5'-phosphate glycosidase [bacterium]|nr:pseudouridine-5'-phosphate glycosidase [bacterium]